MQIHSLLYWHKWMHNTFTINESGLVHQGQIQSPISHINHRLTVFNVQLVHRWVSRCISCYLFSAHRWWMSQRPVRCLVAWLVWRGSLRTRSFPPRPLSPASRSFISSRDLSRWECNHGSYNLLQRAWGDIYSILSILSCMWQQLEWEILILY